MDYRVVNDYDRWHDIMYREWREKQDYVLCPVCNRNRLVSEEEIANDMCMKCYMEECV